MTLLRNMQRRVLTSRSQPVAHEGTHRPRTRPPVTNQGPTGTMSDTGWVEAPQPVGDGLYEDYIKIAVDRMDRRPIPGRDGQGYTHVSSLIGACSRHHVILAMEGIKPTSKVTGGHRVMWKTGKAVEAHVRDSFIESRDRQGIIGQWHCPCEETVTRGLWVDTQCVRCLKPANIYKEIVLEDHAHGITGAPDLPFIVANGLLTVGEIKSMNQEDFDKLTGPLADHVFQASCYRKMFRDRGIRVTDQVSIIYCTKRFKFGSPYKEYHVDVTKGSWAQMTADAWAQAELIKDSIAAGRLPPRTLCSSATTTRAKNCDCGTSCFGRRS